MVVCLEARRAQLILILLNLRMGHWIGDFDITLRVGSGDWGLELGPGLRSK